MVPARHRYLNSSITIGLHSNGPTVFVMVAGEVDLATAPSLAQALQHVIGLGKGVVVDLEGVEFMDCSGLRALLKAVWRADQLPVVDLSVTPGPPQVQKLFELTGADQLVRFVPPTVVGIGAAA